jgi:uncharacterized protein (TIGR03067 family)
MNRATRVLVPALLLIASVSAGDDSKTDLDKMQGTWSIVSNEQDGQKAPAEQYKNTRILFDRDRYEVRQGDEIDEHGTIKLDASKSPKRLELKIIKGEGAGETQLGIYELDGDMLKLCVSVPPGSKERPAALETKEGSNALLMVLKRKKS